MGNSKIITCTICNKGKLAADFAPNVVKPVCNDCYDRYIKGGEEEDVLPD